MQAGHAGYGHRRREATGQIDWAALKRFLTESMPPAAIAHSIHVEAITDPALQGNPLFEEFNLIELNELHHQVGSLGSLLRLEMGDRNALQSLGLNLAAFLDNRAAAMELAGRFPPEVARHPAVSAVMQLTDQSNRQIMSYWPVIERVLALSGAPSPGPMLVGPGAEGRADRARAERGREDRGRMDRGGADYGTNNFWTTGNDTNGNGTNGDGMDGTQADQPDGEGQ